MDILPPFFIEKFMQNNLIIEEIKELFKLYGHQRYGEDVTQQEHAMQCYLLSEESHADLELRVAAFLHDIGHLKYPELEGKQKDMKHEILGSELILEWGFGDKVSSLIASHVWAKRFLVSCEPYYINQLSAASLKSFQLQGGLMTDEEVSESRNHPYFEQALNLRRWDDTGKRIDLESEIPDRVWADLSACLLLQR